MSIRVMSLVWEQSQQTGNALLLLLAIADFADDRGIAFPSITTLAKKARMSERQTQRTVVALERSAELRVRKAAGPRGTHLFQVIVERNLPLFDDPLQGGDNLTPPPVDKPVDKLRKEVGGGDIAMSPGGVTSRVKRGDIAMSPEPSEPSLKPLRGGDTPPATGAVDKVPEDGASAGTSAVSQGFKAYAAGIKAKYGADYPPSAKANGQISNVASRIGRGNVVPVVNHYLAHQDPFYGRVKHALKYLVRDCEMFLVELQGTASAASPAPPTHAYAALLGKDGKVLRSLGEFPVGPMLQIAKKALTDYPSLIASTGAHLIGVRLGEQRQRFSIEELR